MGLRDMFVWIDFLYGTILFESLIISSHKPRSVAEDCINVNEN